LGPVGGEATAAGEGTHGAGREAAGSMVVVFSVWRGGNKISPWVSDTRGGCGD